MISTQNLTLLPEIDRLKQICQAIAALDAIISPEWEYRYFSYDVNWDLGEECASMRDGHGDEYLILFNAHGAIINGLAQEIELWEPDADQIPAEFREFIFGEPVKSMGATFCIWRKYGDAEWQAGHHSLAEDDPDGDGSESLLFMLDGNPLTYKSWAEEYYEGELSVVLPLHILQQVYEGKTLNHQMVVDLNPNIWDWKSLKADLDEIGYPYDLGK
jgi:hypothetical protein